MWSDLFWAQVCINGRKQHEIYLVAHLFGSVQDKHMIETREREVEKNAVINIPKEENKLKR